MLLKFHKETGIALALIIKYNGGGIVLAGFFGMEVGMLLDDMLEKAIVEPKLNCPEWLKNHAQKAFDRKNN